MSITPFQVTFLSHKQYGKFIHKLKTLFADKLSPNPQWFQPPKVMNNMPVLPYFMEICAHILSKILTRNRLDLLSSCIVSLPVQDRFIQYMILDITCNKTQMHTDLNRNIILVNKRAQRALGHSPEEKVKGHSGAIYRGPLMLSTKYW